MFDRWMRPLALSLLLAGLPLLACSPGGEGPEASGDAGLQAEVQAFLDDFEARYVELYAATSEAQWLANTRIIEGDETNRKKAEEARQALAVFSGNAETIEKTRKFLESKDQLTDLQVRQLEAILYGAANLPQTVPDLVAARIEAEAVQNEKLFGFDFQIDGESVSANDIDDVLASSTDLDERLAAWQASKEVGKVLRPGLDEMVQLRNQTVQSLGYDDYFHYQVSDYGMTSEEMMETLQSFIRDIWPLYRELHTWARYELADDYGVSEVPDLLPAHWLPNRWAQDWAAAVEVEGLDLDPVLADKEEEWIIRQGEDFFVSLGFDPLPESFYAKSDLYPAPEGAGYKKNNHASAWHMDLQNDLRSLMSVQPNQRWWATTHHELGHIYYFQAYSRPEVPILLRAGANRAFHEGVGTLLGMASLHKDFLVGRGLIPEGTETDDVQALLKEALDTVVFIPFSAGTMSHFERDLYAGTIGPENYNQGWWDYVLKYQGVVPPTERGEEGCDACTKTHVINDAAQYYDYALSYAILHQIHAHVAEEILGQDPRNTDYYGSKEAGAFLKEILKVGATKDWRQLMQEQLGEDFSAQAMLAYFEPLMDYLKKENEGRQHTLPQLGLGGMGESSAEPQTTAAGG